MILNISLFSLSTIVHTRERSTWQSFRTSGSLTVGFSIQYLANIESLLL